MTSAASPPDLEMPDLEIPEEEHPEAIKPRRALDDTEMDITPMIDITFLLLIFFLVASKMDEAAAVPLPPAKYGMAVPTKSSVIITIGVAEGDEASPVYKGDGANPDNQFPAGDLEAQEAEIATYVSDEILENSQKSFVLLKVSRGVKQREVDRVARAVGKAETENDPQLHVAVLEVQ